MLGGTQGWTTSSQLTGAVGAAIVAPVVLAVYIGVLALMRAPELDALKGLVRRFVPTR